MDILEQAQKNIQDPVILDWALRIYENTKKFDVTHSERMLDLWFNDTTLVQIINDKSFGCYFSSGHLLRVLPHDRFRNIAEVIAEKWPEWHGSIAKHSIPLLAIHLPKKASELFKHYLESTSNEFEMMITIINNIRHLKQPISSELLEVAYRKTTQNNMDGFYRETQLLHLLTAASCRNASSDTLVASIIKNLASQADDLSEKFPSRIAEALFGTSIFYDLAERIRANETSCSFDALQFFFDDHEILKKLDDVLADERFYGKALSLLELAAKHNSQAHLVLEFMREVHSKLPEKHLGFLAIASIAQTYLKDKLNLNGISKDAAINLISLDLCEQFFRDEVLSAISQFESQAVSDSIERLLPSVKYEWGEIHLIKLIGDLRLNRFIPSLIASIDSSSDDFLCDAARNALVQIGFESQKALVESWEDLDESQKIYGLSAIADVGGNIAADFAINRYAELCTQHAERVVDLIECGIDQRLIDLIKPDLNTNFIPIKEAYYLLNTLLGIDFEERDEIQLILVESYQSQQKRLETFSCEFKQKDSINLFLECSSCGKRNNYDIKKVLLSDDADYPHIIIDDVECFSCNEHADQKFTNEASMAITMQLVVAFAWKKTEVPLERSTVGYRGELYNTAKLLYELKYQFEKTDDITTCIELARCNHLIGRLHKAKYYYQIAHERDGNIIEAILGLAAICFCEGDVGKSFELLINALNYKNEWRYLRPEHLTPSGLAKEFVNLYNKAHKKLTITNQPLLHQAHLVPSKKAGRNDPCPCGSGKKFKKCCS